MEWKIYEPKFDPCRICGVNNSVLLPYCKDGDRTFWYPVCRDCRDKIPYEVIPVAVKISEAYACMPYLPLELEPVVVDPEKIRTGFVTQYGKKLLEKEKAMSESNYLQTEIPVLKGWECVLKRPAMYLGKQSLFGLECFLCGLLCANSNFFFEEQEQFYFEIWVRKKFSPEEGGKSFDLARKVANDDDSKAFDVWADWLKEYKGQNNEKSPIAGSGKINL